jgi:methyl-accepting chemotaxis protein
MKLRNRILAIVLVALVGVVVTGALGLQALRQNMLDERRDHILKVARLATGIMDRYQKQEAAGQLTRDEAQAKAKEALSGLRFEDDYLFVRSFDNRMLVHADASRLGQVDKGSKTEDGRMTSEVYVQELAKSDRAFMVAYVARPGDTSKTPVPKLLGAIKYAPWDWVVGNGAFIDDLDKAYWAQAVRFLAVGGALLAVMVGLGSWMMRAILRQLGGEPQYAAEVVNRIAGGSLGSNIRVDGPSDSLLGAMQRMQTSLRDIVLRIREGSESIQAATGEVATGNQDLSNRTEQAAASLEETSSSMQNLADNVQQNAQAAGHANRLAAQASEVAQRGGAVVSQVVSTMGEISASSHKINDIIGVIDGIAFQTNILALNAAVEAARAGEQGRGFAVVAAEVRSLAQRSAEAAKEIKSLISASVGSVEGGAALVQKAGGTMQEIVAAVQQVTDIIGEISAATSQQSTSISEIGSAISHMDQMTQQNAALVEEGAAAAASLREQAQALNGVIGVFHVA